MKTNYELHKFYEYRHKNFAAKAANTYEFGLLTFVSIRNEVAKLYP